MPIYEYVCQSCAHRFEVKQKLSDAPVERCVRCGETVNKVISAPAIMFKGTGWYVTDYSDKLKAPSEGASGNGQADAKSSEGKDGSDKHDKKDRKDQQAPAAASSTDSSSSGSTAKQTAAPAAGGTSSAGSGPASGSGGASTSKPSGSSN